MVARLLLVFSCLNLSLSAQDKEPPYSKPPKLEHLFTDDFERDSLSDYEISGKEGAVTWEEGKLTLGDGAILQRKLDAGPWVETEIDLEFPELTRDGQTSEFEIWMDLDEETDSFVWFRQKRNQGMTRSAIFAADSIGEWANNPESEPVKKPLVISGPLKSWKWQLRFRYGYWALIGPENLIFRAYKVKGNAKVNRLVFRAAGGPIRIRQLKSSQVNRRFLELSPDDSDLARQANLLNQTAVELFQAGRQKQAISIAKKNTNTYRTLFGEYHPSYITSINNLAQIYKSVGEFGKARKLLIEHKKIAGEMYGNQHPMYSRSLNNLGSLLRELNEFQKAELLLLDARTIRLQVLGREHPLYTVTLSQLAGLYAARDDNEKAEKIMIEAVDIDEKRVGRKHPSFAASLHNLGEFYRQIGELEQAEPLLLEAKEIRKETIGQQHPKFFASINCLALLYTSLGQYEQAEAHFKTVRKGLQKIVGTQHPSYARSLNNLAGLYLTTGNFEDAEPLLLESKRIYQEVFGKSHHEYATCVGNLAATYYELGSFEQAERFNLEALEIWKNIFGTEHSQYASSLSNLATLYQAMGRTEKAEHFFLKANAIQEKTLSKGNPRVLATLSSLADIYRSQEEFEKAGDLLNGLVTTTQARFGKQHPDHAAMLNKLGVVYSAMGKIDQAESMLSQALDIRKKLFGDQHPDTLISLNNVGVHYFGRQDYEKAAGLLNQALIETRQNLDRYSPVQSERQRQEYARTFENRFSVFVCNALNRQSDFDKVLDHTVQWKGMALVRQKRNRTFASRTETRSTFEQLKQIRIRLFQHLQKDMSAKNWRERLERLQDKEGILEKELARIVANLDPNNVNSANDIILPPDSCLVVFRKFTHFRSSKDAKGGFVSEPHYLALVKRQQGEIEAMDLGSATKIDDAIDRWRQPIETIDVSGRRITEKDQVSMELAGQKVRRLLWEPLEKSLPNDALVIVSPDSALGRLPLIALPGKLPGTFLLEEKRIVYLPVPALLPQLLRQPPPLPDSSSRALLLGKIDYGNQPMDSSVGLLSYRNRRILRGLQFAPLPGTGAEIDGIGKSFSVKTKLQGQLATEQAFQQNLKNHKILHIATHGFFNSPDQFRNRVPDAKGDFFLRSGDQVKLFSENPELLSGLALANANAAISKNIDDAPEDGILFSAEIAMMPMDHIDLAVLSACETSLGTDENPGEGLIGIQRAFQIAGAKSTIASYWKVDDGATQLLMNKFYENLLKYSKNTNPRDLKNNRTTIRIDALRDAQLWMLNNPIIASTTNRGEPVEVDPKKIKNAESDLKPADKNQRTHPRYWAAFMLSGDWR